MNKSVTLCVLLHKIQDHLAALKLTGRQGWRIRVSDYRVIYEIDDKQQVVTILHIGHRRDVYR